MKDNRERPGNTRGLVHGAKNQEITENTAQTDMECANVVVTLCGEQPVVSSRRVAVDFGKEHKSVLRRIAQLNRETTAQNCAGLFIPWSYADAAGRKRKAYQITRDGFTLLIMSFTGSRALEWKIRYMQAFNQMEEKLRNQTPALPEGDALMAMAVLEARDIIKNLEPEADYARKVLDNKGLTPITGIAKDYGMTAEFMNRLLHSLGVQYRIGKRWYLYSDYQADGYAATKTDTIYKKDGTAKVVESLQWTPKGRRFLYDLLAENNLYPVLERGQHESAH